MSLVADFDLDAPLYREALSAVPGMYVELDGEGVLHPELAGVTFWAAGDDFARFERALERDSTVETAVPAETDVEGWRLYRTHVPETRTRHYERTAEGIVLLGANATSEGWCVRLRFPDRETLDTYRDARDARGCPTTLRRVGPSRGPPAGQAILTPGQREMLAAAHEAGYLDLPRRIMIEELAHRFDVSDRTVTERLRRGMNTLLAHYVAGSVESVNYR